MKILKALACITTVSLLTGCGAVLHGNRQNVSVQSSTPGATVSIDPGTSAVTAPSILSLERKKSYVLTFAAPGYSSSTVAVQNHVGVGTVIADVLLTGLVGVVVDGLTGSWYGLDPESASATLTKKVGVVGPDEIKVYVRRAGRSGEVALKTDAPGVSVAVSAR